MPRPLKSLTFATGSGKTPTWHNRVAELLKERGMDMLSLSRKAGLGDTYVRDALRRGRGGSIEGLRRIAAALDVSVEYLTTGIDTSQSSVPASTSYSPSLSLAGDINSQDFAPIRIRGEVAAGVWSEGDAVELPEDEMPISHLPPDPRWPAEFQYDVVVKGTSLNRVARDGDYLRCVDIAKAGIEIRDGDLVVARRTRGDLAETTAKRAKKRGIEIELWPDSTDPKWQEPLIPGRETGEITLLALGLYSYAPLAASHR